MANLFLPAMKFSVVGAFATLVHIVTFLLFVKVIETSPTIATIPAFLCAVLFSYTLNHSWTFGAQGQHRRYFIRYLLIALVGVGLNMIIMYLCTEIWQKSYLFGLACVVMIVPAFNFLGNRYWGFR